MTRWIATWGLLLGSVTALADDPLTNAFVEELVELREAIGGAEAFATDRQQFAEALQQQSERPYAGPPRDIWSDQSFPERSPRVPPSQPAPWPQRHGEPRSRNQAFDGRERPPAPHPPRPPHAAPSPKHLLLKSAFELETIAHHLDMADLGKDADAVRDAAEKLRKSARGEKKKEKKPKQRKSPGEQQADERREQRKQRLLETAKRETDLMVAEADRKTAEMLRAAEAKRQHMKEAAETKRRAWQEKVVARASQRRAELEKRRRKALPKAEQTRRDQDGLDSPPKGVHGGPHDRYDGSAGHDGSLE